MIRCPRCGVRLSDQAPSCRVHGVPASHDASAPQEHVEPSTPWVTDGALRPVLAERGYELLGRLGEGGFGTVLDVRRVKDGQRLAMKIARETSATARTELALEAETMLRAGSDVAPAVDECGELSLESADTRTGTHGFLVMGLVPGQTLADMFVQAAPLPLESFTRLASGLVEALANLHERGVVHRDLKPENIFLGPEGKVTLIDYGLARPVGAPSRAGQGGAGLDVGTAEYMSPEQCAGEDAGDVRTDVYSAAIILYEALAGAPPFWGKSADVREAQQSRRPQPLTRRGTLAGVDSVIRTCLAKRPEERLPNMRAFGAALDEELAARRTGTLQSVPETRTDDAGAPARRDGGREKRRVGLLFCTTLAQVVEIQTALAASGGQLVQQAGNTAIAAFGHDAADHPVQLAYNAALALRSRRLADRVLVDVGEVSMQRKRDGATRFFGAVLSDKTRIPGPSDPHAVMFTQAAADTLPDVRFAPVPSKEDRFVISQIDESDATTFGLDRPMLVGRDAEVRRLMELAEHALGQTVPTLTTVIAQSGYGKSHLSRELALTLVRLPGSPEIIRLSVREGIAGAPSQAYPELLRRVLGVSDDASADDVRARLVERLPAAERERGLAATLFVLGLVGVDTPEVKRLAAAPSALRLAAARALGEVLRHVGRERPLALVLDDAHLADEATLDALEYATLAEAGARVFVSVFVRPTFEGARPVWSARAGKAETITLQALEGAAATELARRLLYPVDYVSPQVLAKLVERTQGVPRLMVELVRGLKRDGIVRRGERGTGYFIATDELDRLPDLPIVQWNARREVEALPQDLQAHAKLCALLGGRFTVPELDAMLDALERDDPTLDLHLDAQVGATRLVREGLLVRHRNGEYAFRHALLRDTLYELLSEAERTRWHRVALSVYRASNLPEDYVLPRLALHAASSAENEIAAQAYLTLGRRALAAHGYLEAESAFGSAIAQLVDACDTRSVEARRCRGLMRTRLGRHDDALRDLRKAREIAVEVGQGDLALDICLDEAIVHDWLRDFAAADVCVREVESADLPGDTLLYARLVSALGRSAHRRNDFASSVEHGVRAAELAQRFGDAGYETRLIALLMVAPDCAYSGRLELAERYFADAIAEAEAHSDTPHIAVAHLNRSILWHIARNADAAVQDLVRVITLAREFGEPIIEYSALYNLAETKYAIEELEEAHDYSERGLTLARRLWGDVNQELVTNELLLARISLYGGDIDQARQRVANVRKVLALAAEAAPITLTNSESMLLRMLELSFEDGGATEAWRALVGEASAADLTPPEYLEVLEAHATWARRVRSDARAIAAVALEAARERPSLIGERVQRRLASLASPALA